jgi:hypothetical protein
LAPSIDVVEVFLCDDDDDDDDDADDVLVATIDSDDTASDEQTLSNDETEDEEESYDENGDDANIADTQPNAGATRATGRWILEEDAMLTSAVRILPRSVGAKITRQIGS